jgi:hypothetical protein
MSLPETQTASRLTRALFRLGCLLALAACIGGGLNLSAARLERDARPAGFTRGLVQGALMPLAMPNLLVGNDVSIYASHNTGRNYKLGYSLGVNLCGLAFFGLFFWRVSRWRRRNAPVS